MCLSYFCLPLQDISAHSRISLSILRTIRILHDSFMSIIQPFASIF